MNPDAMLVTSACWSCGALTTMCVQCATVVEIDSATGQPVPSRTPTSRQRLVCSDCVSAANDRAREHGGPIILTEAERHAGHQDRLYI
ncbi:hypothetical protein [Streptomyces sp. NPDC091416]|uniref:hypothetical protein n=1 Tax=Streptomyces sp. NPDC091416 TaxID=3366003 RepID=UPI00382F2248